MSLRKSISNTFTVTTLVDGESAPYYFEEKYAWSNDSSTQSVTTPPSISGGWQTSIPPSNGYAYLWRMSIRHVWNESTRSYTQEAAQYFRMSGTNGTSIHIKGHVSTVQNLPTTHVDGDAYVVDANGHLYMWSNESGSWVDIGVFQGEAGKTYYTHIAWASQVNYSGTTVTSVDGFITVKSPNDTTHMWMGVYIDEQSGQDVSNALRYTWSYTKGDKGYDAVTYGFVFTEAFAKADASKTITGNIKGYAYKYVGDTRTPLANTIIRYGYIIDDSGTYADTTTNAKGFFDAQNWFNGNNIDDYAKGSPSIFAAIQIGGVIVHVEYITISLQGDTGGRGKTGRFYYYGGEFDNTDTTKTFKINDAETPYFSHGTNAVTGLPNCHVYNPSTNPSSDLTMAQMWANSSQSWNNAPWQTFTNDFQYLMTRAVFSDQAYLGSFVVNTNWLISQHGKVNRVASHEYTKFYPEFVNGGDLCENFDVNVNYILAGSAYFIGGKTYYIKVSGSSFSSGCQLNVRMYNGSSNVGATLNLTSSSPSGTITFEPTTSGTYYLRANCQSSGMTAKLTAYVDCFVPNYAVDGSSGKTYQTQIYASGGLRSPFTYMTSGGSFTTDFNDNVAVYSGSETSYSLPWDASQSGRKVVITNYYWNGNYSTSSGFAKITAPSGKYFYEDGITKSTLKLSREAVELLGYGDANDFYGWVVLKRIDLGTVSRYGHHMKMLASGRVTGSSSGASVSYHTFDGTKMSVTRDDRGIYTLSWNNSNWYADAGHVFVMVCGYGVIDSGSNPIYASVKSQTRTSITVQTADDDSRNDGAFNFFLMNFNDWIYL